MFPLAHNCEVTGHLDVGGTTVRVCLVTLRPQLGSRKGRWNSAHVLLFIQLGTSPCELVSPPPFRMGLPPQLTQPKDPATPVPRLVSNVIAELIRSTELTFTQSYQLLDSGCLEV